MKTRGRQSEQRGEGGEGEVIYFFKKNSSYIFFALNPNPTGALKTSPVLASSITAANLKQEATAARERGQEEGGRERERGQLVKSPGSLIDGSLGIQLSSFLRSSD
jgi:hypothetical protein